MQLVIERAGSGGYSEVLRRSLNRKEQNMSMFGGEKELGN
jgi:predicted CopG family antitoxin